jgi:bacterial/archaeal transporter family protein
MGSGTRSGTPPQDQASNVFHPRMSWLIPSLLYMLMIGTLGVTTKLALRHLTWQQVIIWTAIVYAVIAIIMLAGGMASVRVGAGTLMAVLSGMLAAGGLIAFFFALRHGAASKVVPITSAYPLVTLVLSAVVLTEHVTALRLFASGLVVGGVILLSLAG